MTFTQPTDILTGLFEFNAYTEDLNKVGSVEQCELEIKIVGGQTIKELFNLYFLPCELLSSAVLTAPAPASAPYIIHFDTSIVFALPTFTYTPAFCIFGFSSVTISSTTLGA